MVVSSDVCLGNRVEEKSTTADAATASRTEVVVEPKDVMICFSSSDKEFVEFLKGQTVT